MTARISESGRARRSTTLSGTSNRHPGTTPCNNGNAQDMAASSFGQERTKAAEGQLLIHAAKLLWAGRLRKDLGARAERPIQLSSNPSRPRYRGVPQLTPQEEPRGLFILDPWSSWNIPDRREPDSQGPGGQEQAPRRPGGLCSTPPRGGF